MESCLLALAVALSACGGAPPPPAASAQAPPEVDADPVALLPGQAIAALTVDVRAVVDRPDLGPPVVALVSGLLPVGSEAGVDVARDVDRVLVGAYAPASVDVVVIASGRFDAAKLTSVQTGRLGLPVVRAAYAGRDTFAVGMVLYTVLTPRTLVAGTSDGVRRVLDRIAAGKRDRALSPALLESIATPGAVFAGAADLASQPVSLASLGLPRAAWLDGLATARAAGQLDDRGLRVTSTATYTDPAKAAAAADAAHASTKWVRILGPVVGVSLDELKIEADGADVHASVALDDRTLVHLLGLLPGRAPAP